MLQQDSSKTGHLRSLQKGSVVFQQGEINAEMFFILKGTVQLVKTSAGRETKIADIEQGGFFGELSLLEGEVRRETAIAASDVILMSVTPQNFNEVISKNPQLAMHIITVLMTKVRDLSPDQTPSCSEVTAGPDTNPAVVTNSEESNVKGSHTIDQIQETINEMIQGQNNSHQPAETSVKEASPVQILPESIAAAPEISPETFAKYCFEKEVTCPVCGSKFKTTMIRESKLRLNERTDELRPKYADIEPLLFSIWVCPDCYYSMKRTEFDKLTQIQKQNLANQVDQRKKYALNFENEQSIGFALTAYRIAIDCCDSLGKKNMDERIAGLWMNMAWLYDDASNADYALEARVNALAKYKDAYTFGTDRTDDQDQKIEYLIGKLSWVTGNLKEARDYFFKVVNRRHAHQMLKQMARDGLEQVKNL